MVFRIKICGVTSVEDARMVVAAGADAVGINFCAASARYLDRDRARPIAASLPAEIDRVGVFVNAPVDWVRTTARQLKLSSVQLHGDEPPDYVRQLAGCAVVRAFRVGAHGLAPVARYLERCRRYRCLPEALLVDAQVPHQYGGTGCAVNWDLLAGDRSWALGLPVILAGGLTPDNVHTAIATARPDAVDTASGVESAAGKKDAARVDRFVRQATIAFRGLLDHDEQSGAQGG